MYLHIVCSTKISTQCRKLELRLLFQVLCISVKKLRSKLKFLVEKIGNIINFLTHEKGLPMNFFYKNFSIENSY